MKELRFLLKNVNDTDRIVMIGTTSSKIIESHYSDAKRLEHTSMISAVCSFSFTISEWLH